jgi:N-acyl-D-amino-acid deacylase
LAVFCLSSAVSAGDIPVTGLPVPELADFDNAVLQVMSDTDLMGCTVGVMKGGRVVYQRGFGWRDENATVAMPENATMRLASVSKVLVNEAINRLITEGLDGDRPVFDIGQPGGGILPLAPWPSLQDPRMGEITVRHLRDMRGNFEKDYSWDSISIYEAMELDPGDGTPPPTSLENITRFALGQTLALDPGLGPNNWPDDFEPPYGNFPYSNFGYNVLVLVIEAETGMSFTSYLRRHLLTPGMWVPATDFFAAKPFTTTGLREPHYFSDASWENVYDATWPLVPAPYGGFNVEAMYGSSFMAASAAPMLAFAEAYPARWIGNMAGSSARIMDSAIDPGVRIAVLCNDTSASGNVGDTVAQAVDAVIGNGVVWPVKGIDGQWVKREALMPMAGEGSYELPYGSLAWALSNTAPGTKLQFRPGDYPFTGVMKQKLLLKAPVGKATLGANAP